MDKIVKFKLPVGSEYEPEWLYTYSVASSRNRFFEIEGGWSAMKQLVEKYFGQGHMDNKVTVVLKNQKCQRLYITSWDNNISIGTEVALFYDLDVASNQYMRIAPIKNSL